MKASFCFQGDWGNMAAMNNPKCRKFYTIQLPLLHCPSDPTGEQTTIDMFRYQGTPVAQTNYKGVMGDNQLGGPASIWPVRAPGCNHNPECTGLFFPETYQKPITFKRITDGTSKTLMIGEDLPEHNVHSFWMHSDTDFSSTYATLNYLPQPPTPLLYWNVMGFRSRHPGGAHFAMADGSATFFNDTIDFTLYRNLSTRAGGESISWP
jgi:prepilin-type processing-associated H-X9-DG protein